MKNCHDVQEQGKNFHYAWFLLSVMLVARELPQDNQFPNNDRGLPEAMKYASLWDMKDEKWIHDTKFFWVLMEVSIQMWINRRLHLSPMV